MEGFSFTYTSNGKCELVPCGQVFPLIVVYCLLLDSKIGSFIPVLFIRIVLDSSYLLIFYLEKFLTWIKCLLFAVYMKLKLSDVCYSCSYPFLPLQLSDVKCCPKMLCWLTGENLKAEEKNFLLTFIVILIISK